MLVCSFVSELIPLTRCTAKLAPQFLSTRILESGATLAFSYARAVLCSPVQATGATTGHRGRHLGNPESEFLATLRSLSGRTRGPLRAPRLLCCNVTLIVPVMASADAANMASIANAIAGRYGRAVMAGSGLGLVLVSITYGARSRDWSRCLSCWTGSRGCGQIGRSRGG
jgi:hypothetical protein